MANTPISTATRPAIAAEDLVLLSKAGVPAVTLADACKNCHDPCYDDDDTHPDQTFGSKLAVGLIDNDFRLLDSVKTSGRTVVIATSKSDWPHSVTDEEDLYAHTVQKAFDVHLADSSNGNGTLASCPRHLVDGLEGLADGLTSDGTQRTGKITILCGSMHPYEEAHQVSTRESVFVFPDYKLVSHLPSASADELVSDHISPRIVNAHPGRSGSELASYVLPYHATILVCSHKKRDKRCHITAPPLISALTHAIEELGDEWHVDTRGDEDSLFESYRITETDTEASIEDRKRQLTNARTDVHAEKHVGIFKVSHVGGHKFAGNVMVWLPNGVHIWYGRVTPEDCKAVIRETLVEGKVVADLLRGGTALGGRGESVWSW